MILHLHTDYKGLTKKQRQSYFLEESEDVSLPDDEARYYHNKKIKQNFFKIKSRLRFIVFAKIITNLIKDEIYLPTHFFTREHEFKQY